MKNDMTNKLRDEARALCKKLGVHFERSSDGEPNCYGCAEITTALLAFKGEDENDSAYIALGNARKKIAELEEKLEERTAKTISIAYDSKEFKHKIAELEAQLSESRNEVEFQRERADTAEKQLSECVSALESLVQVVSGVFNVNILPKFVIKSLTLKQIFK